MKYSLDARFTPVVWAVCSGIAAFAGTMLAVRRAASGVTPRRSFKNSVVVITGGSRGLGLALAEEFGRRGARLSLAARSADELDKARQLLVERQAVSSGQDVLTVECDLTQEDEAEKLIRRTTEEFGRVDVLVNNAGVIHVGAVEDQSVESFREAMDSNFFAMLHTVLKVLPQMLERKDGAIVNIASIGGKIPVPHLAPYSASKFAAVGFSETIHAELRSKGIRVTTVNPALMRTGSYPNAIVSGQKEEEYRWFRIAASLPGLSHAAKGAAHKIVEATAEGAIEIEIGLDAYLAARIHGLTPALTQVVGSLAQRAILPAPSGNSAVREGTDIKVRAGLWKAWSDLLTRRFNQREA